MRLEADLWLDGNRTFLMSRQQRGPGLVAAALLKHFNDRHRQRLLPQSAGELVARRLATATRLRADPAVLVHAGVALTIGCASPAGSSAHFDEFLSEARIRTGVAGQDRAGCRADSCTIQVGTDALDQFGHHVLGEAGIRTCSAGLRTVETRLNAFGQLREIELTPVLRLGLQHLQHMRHGNLLRMDTRSYHHTRAGYLTDRWRHGGFSFASVTTRLAGRSETNTQTGLNSFEERYSR